GVSGMSPPSLVEAGAQSLSVTDNSLGRAVMSKAVTVPWPDSEANRTAHRIRLTLDDLIGPDGEADQRVRPECLGDWNVGGVAASRDQDTTDPRNVVARIERVPAIADIGFEPAGKIACSVGR